MPLLLALTCFLIAFGGTAALVPPVRRLARRRGWVDHPDDHRKLHNGPIPTVGGLAIAGGFLTGLGLLAVATELLPITVALPSPMLWAGATVIIAAGLYDDLHGLNFKGKFLIQLLLAYALLHAGYRIDLTGVSFLEGDSYMQALIAIPLTLLWIVGVINAVNLIDGLDGLAAGTCLIAMACLATIFGLNGEFGLVLVAVLLAGALAGFLIYNFNPASIFMGDSGSLFLGYILAAYALEGPSHTDPWMAALVPVLVLGLPLLDTSLSIVRRLMGRKAIFAPDRDHIHHRLANRGSQRHAVLTLYSIALIYGGSAVLISLLSLQAALSVLALVMLGTGGLLLWLGYLRPDSPDSWATESGGDFTPDASQSDGATTALPELRTVPSHASRDRAASDSSQAPPRLASSSST